MVVERAWREVKENTVRHWLQDDNELIEFTTRLISSWQLEYERMKEAEKLEDRLLRQSMLQQEWAARRGMRMEIETSETGQSHQHLEDSTLLEGMRIMTIWTSTDWE